MNSWLQMVLASILSFSLILLIHCEDINKNEPHTAGLYIHYHEPNNLQSLYPLNRIKKEAGLKEDWINFQDYVRDESTRFFKKLLPQQLKTMFLKPNVQNHYNIGAATGFDIYDTPMDNQEHGSLDFLGRDVVRSIGERVTRIGKALHIISDKNVTDGLDTNKTFFTGLADQFKEHVRVIYPGTRWCGEGATAKSFDDLGTFQKTDRCCRGHDGCPSSMATGEKKFGLENIGLFTRSHCDCDQEFYDCLKNSSTLVSKKIGFTYFTVIGPQCFRMDYPKTGCILYNKGKCVEYHYNTTAEKLYQWFDSSPF